MAPSEWSDLERSKSMSFGFQTLLSHKEAELGAMLLLAINRKAYMASPMTSSLLTLSESERSKSRSLGFQSLAARKCAKLGPYVTIGH